MRKGPFAWGKSGRGDEVYHSPPFRAEVKNEWRCTSTPTYDSTACLGTILTLGALTPRIKADKARVITHPSKSVNASNSYRHFIV
jgi:hypothetical protein